MTNVGPRHGLEQLRRQVLRAADGDRAEIYRARLVARSFEYIAERLEVGVRRDCEIKVEIAQRRYRDELLQRIERQLLEQRHADRGAVGEECERVTVRRRLEHCVRRGDPAGAGIVFDHEILAEFLTEFFRDKTCRDVGDAARAERQDDANRTIGVCRLARTRHRRQDLRQRAQRRKPRDYTGLRVLKPA